MIDYKLINDSINHYEKHGFKRIESPWTVTKSISDITKPVQIPDYTIVEKNKVLVGSGEQSFLYLYNKGFLPLGKFQTVTPCFRNDVFDETHAKYFIKNELINTYDVSKDALKEMIESARLFFCDALSYNKLSIVRMSDDSSLPSYDILVNDIEIGSYGIRECSFLKWIYGTGCAEPRLSRCKESIKKYI